MEDKKEDFETRDGFLEYLTGFVRGFMQKLPDLKEDKIDIPPTMFVVRKEGSKSNVYAFLLEGGREGMKKAVDSISMMKPKLVGVILEGYSNEFDMKTGEIADRKEVILIHVYSKESKIMRVIDKFDVDKVIDSEDFDGYLAINDIDRVFGFE